MNESLEKLRIADPDTYTWVKGRLDLCPSPPGASRLTTLVDETIWGLSQEPGLGRRVAEGMLELIQGAPDDTLKIYIARVHEAARTGPALARLMAEHLVPVLMGDGALLTHFSDALTVMLSKGTYTLGEPLTVLGELLRAGERPSADAFLDLVIAVFGQPISYNLSVRLVHVVPRAVRGFPPKRRCAQIAQFVRVVKTDIHLVDSYLEGLSKGLSLLAADALAQFMDQAIARYRHSPKSGTAFIGLASSLGEEAYRQLQVAVPLTQFKGQLERYLNARLGRPVGVKPLSALPARHMDDDVMIASDGRFIYLPDEIDYRATQAENRLLGKKLVRLEAAFVEFGTFDFDFERAMDTYPLVLGRVNGAMVDKTDAGQSDAVLFFGCFKMDALVRDLFFIFEMARIMRLMDIQAPGLARQVRSLLNDEVRVLTGRRQWGHPLAVFYACLVIGREPEADVNLQLKTLVETSGQHLDSAVATGAGVEVCANLVCRAYEPVVRDLDNRPAGYTAFKAPFGQQIRWDLVGMAFAQSLTQAVKIKKLLDEKGVKVYRSDLQNRLEQGKGRLSSDDIKTLVISRGQPSDGRQVRVDWDQLGLADLIKAAGVELNDVDDKDGPAYYYPEWDTQLQDYLPDFARVQETIVPDSADRDFYRSTLSHYSGLVARIRRAFEFLKPEGMTILRQWPEGDAFDYRALLDFAIDKKAGRIPSERLFIKRIKQERDVAALLLVDLSRSTANEVVGGQTTVLQVAKEALVLFCEALQVVGDTYAVAGFSGTGRHSVDYFRIKDFDEPFARTVQGRLSALQPQRSTRMGAAIRHATAQLAAVPARVRLLIVVTDGFPNDIGYKADYAIADTRRAAQEARALNVHLKAITVNIGSDPGLDDLYGRVHHHVISDVRDLPDKLVRLYSTLTRRY